MLYRVIIRIFYDVLLKFLKIRDYLKNASSNFAEMQLFVIKKIDFEESEDVSLPKYHVTKCNECVNLCHRPKMTQR